MARKLKAVNIEIGARIKNERTAQKMTREDLAKLSGYSANFIQEVERGRSGLSSESIRAFAAALNLSTDTLLFGRASDSFEYVIQKLKTVPAEKMPHICEFAEFAQREGAVYAPEHPQEGDICDTYTIYQIKDTREIPYSFEPYDYARRKLWIGHYQRAYRGVLAPSTTLDDLFDRHNMNSRPFGRRMRSMSVSDVVVLNRGDEEKAFYVDQTDFKEAPQFLNPPVRKRRRSGPER